VSIGSYKGNTLTVSIINLNYSDFGESVVSLFSKLAGAFFPTGP